MPPLLIYVHGFTSSGLSEKAVAVGAILNEQFSGIDYLAPSFSNYPGESFRTLNQLIEDELSSGREQIALIGSSLGGFMATMAAERHQLRVALINPAVRPYELLPAFLGENENLYTGERFVLTPAHMDELVEISCDELKYKENYWLMVQEGDETLDYREAQAYYQGCKQLIEPNGNHRFENFEQHLPEVLKFLALRV